MVYSCNIWDLMISTVSSDQLWGCLWILLQQWVLLESGDNIGLNQRHWVVFSGPSTTGTSTDLDTHASPLLSSRAFGIRGSLCSDTVYIVLLWFPKSYRNFASFSLNGWRLNTWKELLAGEFGFCDGQLWYLTLPCRKFTEILDGPFFSIFHSVLASQYHWSDLWGPP